MGCATAVGEQWAYGGRFPIFLANLPETIPAKFVDQQCGSSMACIHMGFMEIATGFSDIVLAGGYEHMTRIPMGGYTSDKGLIAPNMTLFLYPSYQHWDMMTTVNMGLTAEKLFSQTEFTKEDMDRWGVRSHQLAAKAQADGFFEGEILPIEAEQADGTVMTVDKDQAVRQTPPWRGWPTSSRPSKRTASSRRGIPLPSMPRPRPWCSCPRRRPRKKGLNPLRPSAPSGLPGSIPPSWGWGRFRRAGRLLEKIGLKPSDIDYWEINEAFCIVALNCIKELGLDPEKVNVMGGRHCHRPCPRRHRDPPGGNPCPHPERKEGTLRVRQCLCGRRTGGSHHHRKGRVPLVTRSKLVAQLLADKRDQDFVIWEQMGGEAFLESGPYSGYDRKMCDMILTEARTLAVKEVLPTLAEGDREGASL